MNFLQRKPSLGKRAEHQPSAFRAQVTGQVMSDHDSLWNYGLSTGDLQRKSVGNLFFMATTEHPEKRQRTAAVQDAAAFLGASCRRQVLECGSPLPLLLVADDRLADLEI